MRSYLLSGNAAHYDGVIAALERRGLEPVPVYASGLDGSQDLAETYPLAPQMLARVALAYDATGDAPADTADDEDDEAGG